MIRKSPFVVLCVAVCLTAVTAPGLTEQIRQDFDDWNVESSWGTYTNEGWVLSQGQIWPAGFPLQPFSLPYAGWLRDYDDSTNSWLRSPMLSNGIGRVEIQAITRQNGGENYFELQSSTNGQAWVSLGTFTNVYTGTSWNAYTNEVNDFEPVYLRILKTGDTANDQRLGIDDVVVYNPEPFSMSDLSHSPSEPTIDDRVHVSVTAVIHPEEQNADINLWYRFGTNGAFVSRAMVNTTGSIYQTEIPIPSGRAGTVEYYVEGDYSIFDGGTVFLPESGSNAPASYISIDPYGGEPNPRQFAPSSRRTPLTISEIMYHPSGRTDGLNAEFIEICNSDPVPHDISGYSLTGEIDYTFPSNTWIASRGYVTVAGDPQAVTTIYPTSGTLGPWVGTLSDGGDKVRLRNLWGAVVLEVNYDDALPWPVQADGAGHSLVLARPDYGEDDVRSWSPSERIGGSPGYAMAENTNVLNNVTINEFLAHTDLPQVDFIELYNHGTQTVDISGCVLTDDVVTNRFVMPPGSTLAAGGHAVFYQTNIGFSLSMSGDDIYLVDTNEHRVIDSVRFPAQARHVSSGRYPDGNDEIRVLSAQTPGSTNSGLMERDVVINEIMYHPISGSDADEYIELYNNGTQAVNVGHWRFTDGIDFTIPPGTVIETGGYLVVAKDMDNLLAKYPQLNVNNTLGNVGGQLSDSGERVVLSRPDDLALPFQDFVVVDEVTYSDGWGDWADGDGSSLELVDPRTDNRLGMNWASSDETEKADWVEVDFTDVVSDGDTEEFDILFVLANQRAEFLVDDIFFGSESNETNLVTNPGFDVNADGWSFSGNHWLSAWESEGGYGDDGGVLRVHSLGQGNVRSMATARTKQFDRAETTLSTEPVENDRYRTRAQVRWQAGWPYLRLSLGWYWHEALVELQVPQDLGSPGEPNSTHVPNAPPAIWNITHSPILPVADETVRVTCRTADPDGIDTVFLDYRNTSSDTYADTVMRDDGLPPDEVASDGVYTAEFPGYSSGVISGFRVVATDGAISPATRYAPGQDSSRDALVRFGESQPYGAFIDYSLWVSPENEALWESWETRANGEVSTTVIYNGWRAIYDSTIRWRGNGRSFSDIKSASYSVTLPKVEPIIGKDEVKIDIPSRNGSNGTFLQEYHAYWIARQIGHPAAQVRLMRVHVNGSNLLRQDLQIPTREFCSYWYDDSAPHIFEHRAEHILQHFTKAPTGATNMAKYRHGLQKKRTNRPNAWYERFPLIGKTLLEPDLDVRDARLRALVHPFGFCAYSAVNRVAGNGDVYGLNNAHNGSAYASPQRRLRWHLVDMDPSFQSTPGLYPSQEIGEIVDRPYFVRAYRRILKALAEGPLQPEHTDKSLDDWYNALIEEGYSPTAPTAIKDHCAQRIITIEADLAGHLVPFEVTTAGGGDLVTEDRIITLDGTASFNVERFSIDGKDLPVTHPTPDTWQATFGIAAGTNHITLQGWGTDGTVVTADTITVTSTALPGTPVDDILITEIMYNPREYGAEFIEIHNRSTTDSYDLHGYRLAGVDHTFGLGAVVPPGGYRIVTDDLQLYTHSHTNAEVVIDEYPGSLDNGGETISLLMPVSSNEWTVLDQVTYDDVAPWPVPADGTGPSLQLRDATRDNSRVGNWGVGTTVLYTPGEANSLSTNLPAFPQVWLNEVMPSNVSFVADNTGDFDPWVEIYNAGTQSVDLGAGDYYLTDDYSNLTQWAFSGGNTVDADSYALVWADGEPAETTGTHWHASFELNSASGSVALVRMQDGSPMVVDYLDYSGIPANNSYGSYPDADSSGRQLFHFPTPGTANNSTSFVATLYINEWMADNETTLMDPTDNNFEDWFEIYNAGTQAVNLTGFTLTDDLADTNNFTVPLGFQVGAKDFLLVWADNDSEFNGIGNDLHVEFGLNNGGEAIGLYAPDGSPVDSVTFGPQLDDVGEGRWRDGQGAIYQMSIATPGESNVLFQVLGIEAEGNDSFDLSWQTASGQTYAVWYRADLMTTDPWTLYTNGLVSTGSTMSVSVSLGTNSVLYFKVGLE
jgi:hypothetical protein